MEHLKQVYIRLTDGLIQFPIQGENSALFNYHRSEEPPITKDELELLGFVPITSVILNTDSVFVVTDVEAGWDNVRGVFTSKEKAVARCAERDNTTPEEWNEGDSMNIIHQTTLS